MRLQIGKRFAFVIGGSLLLAFAVALVAFGWVSEPGATEAATDGAAMSLRVDASQTTACPGGPVAGKVCVALGQKFDVIAVADAIPSSGYVLAQVWVDYDNNGLVHKPAVAPGNRRDRDITCATGAHNPCNLWPDLEQQTYLTIDDIANNGMYAGGLTALGPPHPPSFHKGDLFSFSLTCTTTQSSNTIGLLPSGDAIAGTAGALFTEGGAGGTNRIPAVTGLQVSCVPLPTPNPVGGIALDDGLRSLAALEPGSSGSRAGWLMAAAASLALAATGTVVAVGWRRR